MHSLPSIGNYRHCCNLCTRPSLWCRGTLRLQCWRTRTFSSLHVKYLLKSTPILPGCIPWKWRSSTVTCFVFGGRISLPSPMHLPPHPVANACRHALWQSPFFLANPTPMLPTLCSHACRGLSRYVLLLPQNTRTYNYSVPPSRTGCYYEYKYIAGQRPNCTKIRVTIFLLIDA